MIVSLRPFAKAGWIEFIEQEPAVHADTQVFDDLVEEEPLLWLILPENGFESALRLSKLTSSHQKAKEQLEKAIETEKNLRFDKARSTNLDRSMSNHKRHETSEASSEVERLQKHVESLAKKVASLESKGVMTFEETTRCARRFLCGPGEYRKLYQLAIDWRRRLEGDQVGEHTTRRLTALSPFVTSGRGHRAGAAPWTRNPNRLDPCAILAAEERHKSGPRTCEHACSGQCADRVNGTPMPRFLQAQLNYLMMNCNDAGVSAFPEDGSSEDWSSLLKWVCSVEGPKDTPWEGRLIRCTLNFCPEVAGGVYPEKAPQLLVMHPIPYHPNIDYQSGAVCMDLLQSMWSASVGVLGLLISFRSLLSSPTASDATSMPANLRAARLLMESHETYHAVNKIIALGMARR